MKTLTQHTLALLLTFGLAFSAHAQYVTIPDANFRAALQQLYPSCFDGNGMMDTTCAGIVNETSLNVIQLNITSVEGVQYFDNLEFFDCEENQLTSLPVLPNSLLYLWCNFNQITSLPYLPNSLVQLWSYANHLTSLPALPNSLELLSCFSNELTSLPTLPNSLTQLQCNNNQLTSLPDLPDALISLGCDNNQLTSLPILPNSLIELYCGYNQLNCIPVLPSGLNYFYANFNPASCIPNMPQNCPDCQSYPQCNINEICFNENAYSTGKVFLDLNINGLLDNNENNWNNVVLGASPGSQVTASTYFGYAIALDTNTTSTVTLNNPHPNVLTVFPVSHSVTSGGPGMVPGSFDFALQPIPDIYDFEIVVSNSIARPGFDTWANIRVTNAGTVVDSPLLSFDFPPDWVVLNTQPQGTVNGNTITWQDTALGMFQHSNFQVQFNVSALVPIGTPYSYTASVPSAGDITPNNNTFVANAIVRGSYDPNDKACNIEHLNPGYGLDEELFYTIRFQNTGNDTAFTVVLRDTLSPLLQANTLRLVNSSHPRCDLSFMDNARALSFIFPNINLVDSFTNEPLSHGFVQYAIKPQPGLPIGTVIENTADIYFDYNAPVRTNTTVTSVDVVGVSQLASEGALRVYPNPTGGRLRVEAPQPLDEDAKLMVFDMTGRALLEMPFVGSVAELSLERLAVGVYTLALVQEGRVLYRGRVVRK